MPKVQLPGTVNAHTVTVKDNQQSDENLPNLPCDRCEGQKAVCYCLDCADKICGTHLEVKLYLGQSKGQTIHFSVVCYSAILSSSYYRQYEE